jgi:hypothetical protein
VILDGEKERHWPGSRAGPGGIPHLAGLLNLAPANGFPFQVNDNAIRSGPCILDSALDSAKFILHFKKFLTTTCGRLAVPLPTLILGHWFCFL